MSRLSRIQALGSLLVPVLLHAQNIGINANGAFPDASALLDIDGSALPANAQRGLLIPRVALTASNVALPVAAPATSLLIYNTATAGVAPNNVVPGYYYWDAAQWVRFGTITSGWNLLGNAGTTAGTNFIGTTDATAFVIKTGSSAAANERARVMATGQVVLNNTSHATGDVFSSYANNTTNGTTTSINNTAGTFAVNGYASGNGTGIYGETNGGASTTGTAVWGDLIGTNTPVGSFSRAVYGSNTTVPLAVGGANGVAIGVHGDASGVVAPTNGFVLGVFGSANSGTGNAFGVYGGSASIAGAGVFGIDGNPATNSSAYGVQGQAAGTGGSAGVRGINTATILLTAIERAYGVHGSCAAVGVPGIVAGVRGDVTATGGNNYGVLGTSASLQGFGVNAYSSNASGTGLLAAGNNVPVATYLTNGSGAAFNGTAIGGFGIGKMAASGIGLVGVGNDLTGSIFTPVSGSGVVGVGTQYGIMGFATTTVLTNGANNNTANGANASAGGYFEVQAAGVAQTWAYVGVRDNGNVLRKIIGPGTVNTVVPDVQGKLVALSCPEAPENLFQDLGAGRLQNGRAHITLDPVLAKNIVVNAEHPLRVFVQLEGDCQGVYVTNKKQNGFDVVELNGGTSNTTFTWMITANRADEVNPDGTIAHYSAERFPPAPGAQQKTEVTTTQSDNEMLVKAPVTGPIEPLVLPKEGNGRRR